MIVTPSSQDPSDGLSETLKAVPWPAQMCKQIIESAPWPMFVMDCETRCVVEANQAALARYEVDSERFRTCDVDEATPPHRPVALSKLLDPQLDGEAVDAYAEHILPDGTVLPVEIRSFPLLWKGRASRFFMVRDLLSIPPGVRDPRLDITGQVSGSITHDFNNLLTVILAVAEQLQEGEGDPEQKINLIAKTVRSAQELARQRLTLGGSLVTRRERLDLNGVLSEQAETLKVLLGKQVHLHLDIDTGLWPVFADAAQWRELILNLAVNAHDAMPGGGTLLISARNESLESDDPDMGLAHGHYVHLIVEDTGHGMSEETRLQAFTPYFTTKSRHKNSGLGLASVLAVVQQSGGSIRLSSAPGQGTRFDIFVPALARSAETAPHDGLVLLVEDSDELRKMMQEFLAARGYEVIACGSAEVALKWARTLNRTLDLVICDLILPDLPGDMLVEQLRHQRPDTRVIFMSGQQGAADDLLANVAGVPPPVCLEKPFSLHQLAAAVADTLGIAALHAKVDSIPATG